MLPNILWPLVVLGGLGAAIDFLIGSERQRKIKDWLTEKWVNFEDMKWSNFSTKEAQYFVHFLDRVFGAKLLSWRRIASSAVTYALLMATLLAIGFSHSLQSGTLAEQLARQPALFSHNLDVIMIVIGVLTFAVSTSVTRAVSILVIRLSAARSVGPSLYVAMLGVHYVLFGVWTPIVEALRVLIMMGLWYVVLFVIEGFSFPAANEITPDNVLAGLSEFATQTAQDVTRLTYWEPQKLLENAYATTGLVGPFTPRRVPMGTFFAVSLVANALRFLIAIALLVSFLFREWIGRVVSLVWVRVLEDRRGAFTLVLGGIGALAGTVREIAGHL
jgi:hypothetical protein